MVGCALSLGGKSVSLSAARGVTSSTRVVIADLIVGDHRDIFQELELYRNISYIHCLLSLEEHLHFLK